MLLGAGPTRVPVALAGLLAAIACRLPNGPTVIVTQTIGDDRSSSPSPTPNPGSQCPSIPRMRVGFFGFGNSCPNPPRNSAGILPLDCIADATATPIGTDGNPVPSNIHGQNIVWSTGSFGAGRVRIVEQANTFNRTVIPEAVGDVSVTAILTPPGCSGTVTGEFTFRVVSAGARE